MPEITKIQVRRGTAAEWTAANPILSEGTPGWEEDTFRFKVGNGTSTWSTLPYAYQTAIDGKSDVGHTHPSTAISDSTATGRAVLTAASAAAARSAIGAGTSDLVLGTGAANAMPGNKTFAFSEITGLIATAQLPPISITNIYTVANEAAMLALTAERGDMVIRQDNGETFVLSTESPTTLADWKQITAPGNVTSVAGRQGAVVLTKTDVGLANVDNTTDLAKPISTATQTALNAKEGTITAGTTAQYRRGDKTWQTLDKAAVGLSAVDNTSDANKPVSTAQQNALNLKANLASPTFTGTVTLPSTTNGLTKSNVGLSNVDNTTDLAKPISTATQTALNAKAAIGHIHSNSADITVIDGGSP